MSQTSISSYSGKLLIVLWFFLLSTAIVNSSFWFAATLFNAQWFDAVFPVEVTLPLSISRSVIGFIPSMLSSFLTMAMLWQLIVLFGLYKKGCIFEQKNAVCYKRLSYLLILAPFVKAAQDILLSIVLSYDNGFWEFSFNVGDEEITMMVIGLIAKTISSVMERAIELREESELTI